MRLARGVGVYVCCCRAARRATAIHRVSDADADAARATTDYYCPCRANAYARRAPRDANRDSCAARRCYTVRDAVDQCAIYESSVEQSSNGYVNTNRRQYHHAARACAADLRRAAADQAARAEQSRRARPSTTFVTIAALDPDKNDIHHITVSKPMFLRRGGETRLATSLGKLVRLYVARPNYVNTAVVISDERGNQLIPLVVEYPIEKFGSLREMAYYTSAHPALMSPELVKAGQAYVRTMLDLAAKRLKDKGRTIAPEIIDIAERLCLVEHVDHQRFRTENRLAIYDDVFALYALNGLDTYRYSISSAGAGGMVQMIPPTYQMVRRMHPGVGLNPDFVLGMRNHGNALEAMLLYMQDTWNDLAANFEVQYALSAKYATQKELMSAGYNSNPAKLPGYLARGGTAWRTLIPRETQMYLQIYSSIESLVPMKERGKPSDAPLQTAGS